LPYNAGYLDGQRSILERLGLTGVDLGEVADAVKLAANEPTIQVDKARLHLHAVPS
jgi:hypothetical protein